MNKELLTKELEKLIEEARVLRVMFYYMAQTKFNFDKSDLEIARQYYTKDFSLEKSYNSFYTRALPILEKVLPNRVTEFNECYKLNTPTPLSKYDISTFLVRVQCINLSREYEMEAIKLFERQQSIIEAARDLLDTQIFNLENDIRKNVYIDELDIAENLFSKGYIRASGSVAGVVLENHLKNVCKQDASIQLNGSETLSQYNQLLKSKIGNIIWGRIDSISRIRNACDHAKDEAPTKNDIKLLIDETKQILKDVN